MPGVQGPVPGEQEGGEPGSAGDAEGCPGSSLGKHAVLNKGPDGLQNSGLDSRLLETQKNSNSRTTWKNVGRVSAGALGIAAAAGARILARDRGASESGRPLSCGVQEAGEAQAPEGGDLRRPAWTLRVNSPTCSALRVCEGMGDGGRSLVPLLIRLVYREVELLKRYRKADCGVDLVEEPSDPFLLKMSAFLLFGF